MNTFGGSGFGQAKPGGFNQPAAQGGFGQMSAPQQQAGGFGQQQPQQQAGGFGQPQQQQMGGFGQPAQQQQQAGGFGQPQQQQPGAFGQPAQQQAGGFGQPQQQQAGGFGQPQQQQQQQPGAFGQPAQQQAGGFGQPAAGTGFGQPQQQQQAGAFGQPAAGGFGQRPAGGFGQPAQQAGGFGQPAAGGFGQQPQQQQQQAGAFGQPAAGGFAAAGRGATGGFGQPAQQAGGFGQAAQQQPAAGGFGQAAAGGFGGAGRGTTGFGQPAAGGFGQQQQAGGFGQPQQQQQQQTGAFGQPAQQQAGGFGQPAASTGFGQPQQQQQSGAFGQPAAGGFGQRPAGGFGQPAQQAGGFGQPAAGGFGQQPQQQQQQAGAFGQPAAGGFAAAGRGATGGFGQPAQQAGGFGQAAQQQPAAGGFGQAAAGGFGGAGRGTTGFGQPAAGGFGQQQQAGGFGQPQQQQQQQTGAFGQPAQQQAGGFGQPAASTGFGQPAQQPATGFGQPAAGGFGQAAAGGFGQAPSGGFGAQQPAAGGFGQAPAPATTALGGQAAPAAAPSNGLSSLNFSAPNNLAFMSLPDLSAKPYGDTLLFDSYERPVSAKQSAAARKDDADSLTMPHRPIHTWMVSRMQTTDENGLLKQGPASLGSSALSPKALQEMLAPAVQLGAAHDAEHASPAPRPPSPSSRPPSAGVEMPVSNAAAPRCTNPNYVLHPSLARLSTVSPDKLRAFAPFAVSLQDGSAEIRFLDPVNLVRVDIGAVLHLDRDGRAILYPSGGAPPRNAGLNVRAEVRVRDDREELRNVVKQHCDEVHGTFDGYHQGCWVYRLNDTTSGRAAAGNATRAAVSGSPPLTINRDEDEYSHNLDDTRDDLAEPSAESERSVSLEEEVHSVSEAASPAAAAAATTASAVAPNTVIRQYAMPAGGSAVTRPSVVERRLGRAAGGVDFELPYALPDMSTKTRCEPFAVKLGAARPVVEPRVLYVKAEDSAIQRAYVNHPQPLQGSERTMRGMLARSARAGWSTAGTLAFASHAELRDGAEAGGAVPEVVGACAVAATPFHWHKPANRVLTQCAVAVLRCLLPHTDVAEGRRCPLATVNLHRAKSANTLSAGKLEVVRKAVEDVAAAARATLTRVEALSTRQTASVLALLSALYALPEGDDALPNAMEEARYLRQLRHRNLAGWLKRELAAFLDESRAAGLSPAEELVQIMLCHKLREARATARSIANDELARVVRVCGEGNQFGGYVEMAKGGFRDGEEVRQRVVGLLSGRVEPFITSEEYSGVADGGAGEVRPVPTAATWKQLLGIFTFYGCTPDTPAEDIIHAFLDRLRAPSSRKLNPLPPYAERVDARTLSTKRGKDLVRRGNTFQDAALLLLEGFAAGSAPPASCLHPHASSYDGTDYLTAFAVLVAIRAIQLPREQPYRDAEVSVLLGMSAQLECNDETWFWGLLPLHLIEHAADREDAVRGFCKRNAMRASTQAERGDTMTDFNHLRSMLRVEASWLEPVVFLVEEVKRAQENTPSIATHAALEKALIKLAL